MMTTYREVELRRMFEIYNSVTVTVVPDNGEPYDATFTDINEAINQINILENENSIYF